MGNICNICSMFDMRDFYINDTVHTCLKHRNTERSCKLIRNNKTKLEKNVRYYFYPGSTLYKDMTMKNKILYETIKHRNLEAMKLILDFGADVNYNNITFEDFSLFDLAPPLLFATRHKWEDGIVALLEYKADINIYNAHNETALNLASYTGYTNIVKLLLSKNANTEIKDAYELTPLLCAVYGDYLGIAYFLIDSGCCIDYKIDVEKIIMPSQTFYYLGNRKQVINDHNVGVNKRNTLYLKTSTRVLKHIMPEIMKYSDLVNHILSFGCERLLSLDNVGDIKCIL